MNYDFLLNDRSDRIKILYDNDPSLLRKLVELCQTHESSPENVRECIFKGLDIIRDNILSNAIGLTPEQRVFRNGDIRNKPNVKTNASRPQPSDLRLNHQLQMESLTRELEYLKNQYSSTYKNLNDRLQRENDDLRRNMRTLSASTTNNDRQLKAKISEVKNLQQKLDKCKNKLRNIAERINDIRSILKIEESTDMSATLAEFLKRYRVLEQEKITQEQEIRELRSDIYKESEKLKQELDKCKNDLQGKKNRLEKQLNERIDILSKKTTQLQQRVLELENNERELTRKVRNQKDIEDKNVTLKTELTKCKNEMQRLKDVETKYSRAMEKLETQERFLNKYQTQEATNLAELNRLRAEEAAYQQEIEHLRALETQYSALARTDTQQDTQLTQMRTYYDHQVTQFANEKAQLEQQFTQLQADKTQCETQLTSMAAEIERLNENSEMNRLELVRLTSEASDKGTTDSAVVVDDLKKQNDELRAQNSDVAAAKETLQREIENLQDRIKTLDQRHDQLQEQMNKLENEKEIVSANLERMQKENVMLRETIDAIVQSINAINVNDIMILSTTHDIPHGLVNSIRERIDALVKYEAMYKRQQNTMTMMMNHYGRLSNTNGDEQYVYTFLLDVLAQIHRADASETTLPAYQPPPAVPITVADSPIANFSDAKFLDAVDKLDIPELDSKSPKIQEIDLTTPVPSPDYSNYTQLVLPKPLDVDAAPKKLMKRRHVNLSEDGEPSRRRTAIDSSRRRRTARFKTVDSSSPVFVVSDDDDNDNNIDYSKPPKTPSTPDVGMYARATSEMETVVDSPASVRTENQYSVSESLVNRTGNEENVEFEDGGEMINMEDERFEDAVQTFDMPDTSRIADDSEDDDDL